MIKPAVKSPRSVHLLSAQPRLFELLKLYNVYYKATTDTWPALFKTAKHYRRLATKEAINSHIHWMILCKFPNCTGWTIDKLRDEGWCLIIQEKSHEQ